MPSYWERDNWICADVLIIGGSLIGSQARRPVRIERQPCSAACSRATARASAGRAHMRLP